MSTVTSPAPVPIPPPASSVRDDEPLFEIIDGRRVELPPMSAYASLIVCRLINFLADFARQKNLGQAVTEVLFHLALPTRGMLCLTWLWK